MHQHVCLLKNSQDQEFWFGAIGSDKLSQSVDAPSTRLSFFLLHYIVLTASYLCVSTATVHMASDPSELMLKECMMHLQTDSMVLGLG